MKRKNPAGAWPAEGGACGERAQQGRGLMRAGSDEGGAWEGGACGERVQPGRVLQGRPRPGEAGRGAGWREETQKEKRRRAGSAEGGARSPEEGGGRSAPARPQTRRAPRDSQPGRNCSGRVGMGRPAT